MKKTVEQWLNSLKDGDREEALKNIMPGCGGDQVESLAQAVKRVNWGVDINKWVDIHYQIGTETYFDAPQETPESIKSKGYAKLREAIKDNVNFPDHYMAHPSGIECIEIVEHMNFCLGNAIKYLWRSGLKGDAIEDLQKAVWYINREIKRRENNE